MFLQGGTILGQFAWYGGTRVPTKSLRTAAPYHTTSTKNMRWPGIEPGSTAWKAAMLTIIPPTLLITNWLFKSIYNYIKAGLRNVFLELPSSTVYLSFMPSCLKMWRVTKEKVIILTISNSNWKLKVSLKVRIRIVSKFELEKSL